MKEYDFAFIEFKLLHKFDELEWLSWWALRTEKSTKMFGKCCSLVSSVLPNDKTGNQNIRESD